MAKLQKKHETTTTFNGFFNNLQQKTMYDGGQTGLSRCQQGIKSSKSKENGGLSNIGTMAHVDGRSRL